MSVEIAASQPYISEPNPKSDSFKERMRAGRSQLELGAGHIDYVRHCPENPKFKEPIVISPGYTEGPEFLEKLIETYYNRGHIVYAFSQPTRNLRIPVNGRPQEQEQKVQATVAMIRAAKEQDNPGGKVDLVGRSDGSVNAAHAAAEIPELVATLTLIDPKLTPQENEWALARRFGTHASEHGLSFIKNPFEKGHLLKGAVEGAKHAAPHHILSSFYQIRALAKSDVRPILPKLREKNIVVVGVLTTRDPIFTMTDTQQAITDYQRNTGEALFDGFYSVGPVRSKKSQETTSYKNEHDETAEVPVYYGELNHGSIYDNSHYLKGLGIIADTVRARSDSIEKAEAEKRVKGAREANKNGLSKFGRSR